ncbi:hypothetical protein ACN6LM_003868 [Streptomyces sp. SAS_281]|uniref:hypothetical protein n=1 Tax=Streptomyces sp. SAS_281 TaxID=3412744 RepID=UPI00403C76B5
MICRNAAEAFQAGWNEQCVHDVDPVLCPTCQLTADEITALSVLHRTAAPVTTAKRPVQRAA